MIITHPGQAHRDDFLSCCLLLAKYGGPIERRDPTSDELADEKIFIVDVGGEYNPLFRNFDHHQFERNHDPVCALTLVMQYMDLDHSILPWFATTEILDSKGPFQFCSKVGITPDMLETLQSPIEGHMLRMFASFPQWEEDTALCLLMKYIGLSMIEYVEKVSNRITQLEQCTTYYLPYNDSHIPVLKATVSKEDPALGVELFCKRLKTQPVITITCDDRGPGYCLYRRNDDPRVDFSKIEGAPGVIFAHKNGFIAKIDPDADWQLLIHKALV